MSSIRRPMLAARINSLQELRFPLYASSKLDGIRAIITTDGPRTRSLKPIKNTHIRKMLETLPVGLDGEIGCGNPVDFKSTTSKVMSQDGMPEFRFFIFDIIMQGTFEQRQRTLAAQQLPSWCEILPQYLLRNAEEVEALYNEFLFKGHEGVILRSPKAEYKFGRSTLKEQGMLKIKPWEDAEALCIGTTEEQYNGNVVVKNELGYASRSSSRNGKIGKGTLGTLVVKSLRWKNEFEIGSGFTAEEREALWRDKPLGKIVKFKFVSVGGYEVPRHAVFLGFRDESDMGWNIAV